MWIDLTLPERKVFLIHKRYLLQEQELFRTSLKHSLFHRALRIGVSVAIAGIYISVNLLLWALIISLAFLLKHFSGDYSILLWLAWGVVVYRAAHLILHINEHFGDPMSRMTYRMGPRTLRASLTPGNNRIYAYCRNKLLQRAASKGHPVNTWQGVERVSGGIVTFLLCLFFVAGWLPTESLYALGRVLLIVLWLSIDLLLLGLLNAFFGDIANMGQFGESPRITFEFIKIAMAFGIVATTIKHFKSSYTPCETYTGTLANLAKHLTKYESRREGVAIYECGIAPKDAPESDLVARTPADIQAAAEAEVTALSESIDQQMTGVRRA